MSARPQFTITLGRSGQVVKRARPIVDGSHSVDDMPSLGGKRSVRERLESNTANYNSYRRQYENKRQRTDGHDSRFIDKNMRDKQIKTDHRVGRDDLRWKLMKKSLSRRNLDAEGQRGVDLREKLSRNVQASSRSDSRQHVTESSASGLGRRIPSTRSADDLLELDSHRKSYSWTSDRQRLGSPDRFISTQRHMPPSRRYEELRHASAIRSIDASRPSSFLTNSGIGDASRSLNFMAKDMSVNANPVVRAPAPGIIEPRSVLKPEEPLTVASLLHSLGLGKYAILFQAEEVDMTALRQMGDTDLKELGIPMGPRKILLAALSHARQRQR